MPRIARRLRITGRVQGVFYRDWTVETAKGLGVSGWVRNRRDGSVEAVAIGDEKAIAALIARCQEGSPPSKVEAIDISEIEPETVDGFEKRPTA